MGLKSLILLNRNSKILFFNCSYLDVFNYNRYFYFFLLLNNFFNNFFNNILVYSLLLNLKKKKIKNKIEIETKMIFFGKINIFIYQNWFILKINSHIQKKNKYKKNKVESYISRKILKKKKVIEL